MKIQCCATCNRVILSGFLFCPYCGACIEGADPEARQNESKDTARLLSYIPIAPTAKSVDASSLDSQGLDHLDRMIQALEKLDAEISKLETANRE